jgi:hypothetical protein
MLICLIMSFYPIKGGSVKTEMHYRIAEKNYIIHTFQKHHSRGRHHRCPSYSNASEILLHRLCDTRAMFARRLYWRKNPKNQVQLDASLGGSYEGI